MRTSLLAVSIFGLCFLSGCGPAQYRAEAAVYVEAAPEHPNAAIDIPSEIDSIKSLAKPLIPEGAEVTVTRSTKNDIIRIAVTFTDPVEAADICNRIVDIYVAKVQEGVNKTLLEKANAPLKPI